MHRPVFKIPNRDYFFDHWFFIIPTLIIFFPLGFLLLLRKRDLHRRNVFEVGNTSMIIGIAFFLLSSLLLFYLDNIIIINNEQLISLIHFIKIYGIIVFIFGMLSKLKAMHYKKYIHYVINDEINDINTLSSEVKESTTKTTKTLNELIKKNYLTNYEIKENKLKYVKDEDVIEDYGKYENTSFHPTVNKIIETNLKNQKAKPSGNIIQCPNCGANNKISYQYSKCSYCNSDLAEKRKQIIRERYQKQQEEEKQKQRNAKNNINDFKISPYTPHDNSDDVDQILSFALWIILGFVITLFTHII